MIARYLFERLAGLPCDVEIASEFRYRDPAVTAGTLALAVSQSGETADTLAALRWCKARGLTTAAIVNAHESTMAREADIMWPTHAGPEIGVASTKAFTSQVTALTALAVAAAAARGRIDSAEEGRLARILLEAPRLVGQALEVEAAVTALASKIARARDVLYLGRGAMSPLAYEGALKLKEISYIHAEGYPSAEMKHGPIALVDENTPSVFILSRSNVYDKVMSNLQEVKARRGPVIAIVDQMDEKLEGLVDDFIEIPYVEDFLQPIVASIPLQLLAYHIAVLRGCDVDKPRNLAKSVTVE
jgi:glucosamine--fructose-6-phosphate aminotransferase (isomerizing)